MYDVAIIGGGINGAAIARDAAGRGLSVFLCEEGDLGCGSSSATTKVIHGGLRFLEGLQLGAMREAVVEREVLLRAAPHLVWPLRFLIPHHERQWSRLALGLGLFTYDHVARTSLPKARRVDLESGDADDELQRHFALAFAYSDCVADDSRLVILNALDARARGASIHPRIRCTVAERDGGRWRLSLESTTSGERFTVLARVLVNAAGASAGEVLNHVIHSDTRVRVRMVKGSHLLIRRNVNPATAYALPNADGRIVYALPYTAGTMVIGAAASAYDGDPASATVGRRDVAYLVDVAGQYFHTPIHADDVLWTFACVRALPDDPASAKRGRAVIVDAPPRVAPLITAFGGTLTSHRRLAEQVVDRIGKFRNLPQAWTGWAVLPGGGFPARGATDLVRALRAAYPFVAESHAWRLVQSYGTRATSVLTGTRSAADLGTRFGGDLTEAEVNFLRHEEWAETAEDILWRRSKLGLTFNAAETRALAEWLAERPVAAVPVT